MNSTITVPRYWYLSTGRIAELNGNKVMAVSGKTRDTLPAEFYSHQLLEVDTSSEESVLAFTGAFGVPLHPLRNRMEWGYSYSDEVLTKAAWHERREAIDLTNEMLIFGDSIAANDVFGESACENVLDQLGVSWWTLQGLVSLAEVLFAIEDLQKSFKEIIGCILGENAGINYYHRELVNDSALSAMQITTTTGLDYSGIENYSLTNAICTQAMATFADEAAEWKVCPQCGKPFKRFQRLETQERQKTNKQPSRSKYCSKYCQNKAGKARYNAAHKPADTAQ